jgi:mannitol/fructose-specific phosphotransferase system IIA component (Ntr-type)
MDWNDFLSDFPDPKPPVVDVQAENRWDAIDELLDQLVVHKRIKPEDREAIAASVKKRESSMTTGIGFGIAIPHASTDLVSQFVGIIGRSSQGIQFDALDLKPVRLAMLFLVPKGKFQEHVQVLANIAKLLHKMGPGGQGLK